MVLIYDTTLRDGAQQAGISLSLEDKLNIAEKLDDLGIHFIEGGWPGSNPKDLDFFSKIKKRPLHRSKLAAFGSTRRAFTRVEEDPQIKRLLEAETPVVTVVGKSWDFHVKNLMQIPLEENLRMIADTIRYLKQHGLEVIYDAEHFFDGYKHNPAYALEAIKAADAEGCDWITLCDTNGGLMPFELEDIIKVVRDRVHAKLGFHGHNDSGVAVANSLIAAQLGVSLIQGTFNGYGERCGNANLCTIIPNLKLKLHIDCISDQDLRKLNSTARYISEVTNMGHDESQPYVGGNAFTHKAGLHVSGVMKHPESYEHASPDAVGNSRRILVSELAGKSNVAYKLAELNIPVDKNSKEVEIVLNKLKELEYLGYQFDGADASFDLLVRKTLNLYQSSFELKGFRVIVEMRESGESYSEATIKVKIGDTVVHTAAEGNGPVNALDNALRKALEHVYPEIRQIKLADYKVRVLDGADGTGAKVRVLIESKDEESSWSTMGMSPNILEASWQALVDSIEYGLSKSKRLAKKDS